jgi:hypothetical protein
VQGSRSWAPVLAAFLAVAAAPGASGHDEAQAPALDPRIAMTWHEPASVPPGTQWEGFLRLAPGHNVTAAYYQVCRVGQTCFAPPTPAEAVGNDTFAFDTTDYTVGGEPVEYQAGWRLGVKWCLQAAQDEAGDCTWVPAQDSPAPEDHYFVFQVQGQPGNSAAAPSLPLLGLMLLALAVARRA